MKRKSNIESYLIFIFLIGVISTLFTSDIPFQSFFENMISDNIEATLENLNIGLAFVAFGFLFFYLIARLSRGGKYKDIEPDSKEDWEDQ